MGRAHRRTAAPLSSSLLLAILVLMLACWPAPGAAAAPAPAPERWSRLATPLFTHLGLEEGLPHPIAMALAQDGDGYIWIGTQRGLARWDGYRMRSFLNDPADAHSLPSDFIHTLHVDRLGRLWVGTAMAGMAMYDKTHERFIRYEATVAGAAPSDHGLSGAAVNAIASDAAGGIWVGTSGGLDYVPPDGGPIVRHRHQPAVPGGLRDNRIRALLLDRDGALWIGSSSGLSRRPAQGGPIAAVAVQPGWEDAVLSLGQNAAGQIAFGTLRSGIGVIDPATARARLVALPDTPDVAANMVLAVAEIVPGTWWAATYGGGVLEYKGATGASRRIQHQAAVTQSLGSDRVAALLRDRSGLIWVSNERSVDTYNPHSRAIDTIFGGQQLQEAAVSALMTDGANRVWVALADQGIDLIARDGTRTAALRPDPARPDTALPNRMVLAMSQDGAEEAWIGTQLGLYRSSARGTAVARVPLAPHNPYPRVGVIMPLGDELWLGTFDGLLRYDIRTQAISAYTQGAALAGGLSDNRIHAVLPLANGTFWVGTRNGLNLLDPIGGMVEQIYARPGVSTALSDPVITGLLMDAKGRLWVGTHGGGICVLEGRAADGTPLFRRLGRADGLPSTTISSLRADGAGMVWVSTSDGVAVVDPATLRARPLERADGLAFRTFYVSASALTQQNELLFGATSGLAVVHPEAIRPWTFRPPLTISSIRMGGQPVTAAQLTGTPDLPARALTPQIRTIEVELAVLDYSAPDSNRYAYWLEGYDQGWTETDAGRRLVSYSNLPPGSYTLRLRGANRNGAWTDELKLPLRVEPAWHQTWWAYLCYVLAATALAWAVVHWRIRHLHRNRAMLQALVYARTQHLEKLNAIVKSINEQPDFDTLLHTILHESTVIGGVDAALALVREPGTETLTLHAAWQRTSESAARAHAPADWSEAHARYVRDAEIMSNDIFLTRHREADDAASAGACALLAVRILIGGHVEGYLVFENRDNAAGFDGSDLDLLKALKEPFVSAFQKATALRQIELARANAEAATRAKSEFLANISHEIRTPMNAILGFAGLGSHLALPAKPLDYFRKIGRAGQSLLGIINDVLDFSKIESGKLELEHLPFDLPDTLNQIADLFAWRAAEKGLELVVWAAPGVPSPLLGDSLRLSQVLVNLVGNALKFTDSGHIQLRVDLDPQFVQPDAPDADGALVCLRFTVEDTGMGISADQQQRLFQAFAQADASTTRLYGGTGLGLAISQQLVHKMGGAIRVDSAPGAGSRFSFSVALPSLAGSDGNGAHGADPDAVAARGRRVLIVDDSAPTREMLEAQLRSFGLTAHSVASGAAALFALELEPYDLVLMDWDMPDMDGVETARRIKADMAPERMPAIVMVTAFGREHIKQAAEQAGVDGFLVKPVNPRQLLHSLLAAMGLASAADNDVDVPRAAPPSEAMLRIAGARILLVDDNAINLQVASEILLRAGVACDLANNGMDAVRMVDQREYDAVLMDIQMPDMDGYHATARIREQPQHARLPVIAMTAHAVAGYRDSCLAMGMNDYVTKPIDPDTLYGVLANWVQGKQERAHALAQLTALAPGHGTPGGETAAAPVAGIDMAAALGRLGGNSALLTRLLRMFANDFAASLPQIREAIAAGDLDRASRLVHKIKGAAGNLSALALYEAASRLEAHLHGDAHALPDGLLDDFAAAFAVVLDGAAPPRTASEIP